MTTAFCTAAKRAGCCAPVTKSPIPGGGVKFWNSSGQWRRNRPPENKTGELARASRAGSSASLPASSFYHRKFPCSYIPESARGGAFRMARQRHECDGQAERSSSGHEFLDWNQGLLHSMPRRG